jgi:AraC-like DNA-binding protein
MQSRHDSASASHAPASNRNEDAVLEPGTSGGTAAFDELGGDALSDVLQSIRLTGSLFFLVDATSPWGSTAPAGPELTAALLPNSQQLVSYHLVSSGSCWCEIDGEPPARLEAGDVAVIPHGHAYSLATAPGLRDEVPVKWYEDAVARRVPFVVPEGGGGPERVLIICGFLGWDVLPFNPLVGALPTLLHVRGTANDGVARLRQFIEFAAAESAQPSPGGHCVLLRIGELIFVEVVRRYLATLPTHERGWLAALRDPAIGRAIALLHREPQAQWSLELLAKHSGISRSSLAQRFTEMCGQPPMQYLSRWRMQLAARKLVDDQAKVATIALDVGYESEAAFSRAFKKLLGVSPAEWRKRHRAPTRR